MFLGAVFTYQFTYLAWMRLESDEIKGRKRGLCSFEAKGGEREMADATMQMRCWSWRGSLRGLLRDDRDELW